MALSIPLLMKSTTACPYCYQKIDLNKVAFRCSGHGAPGLPACEPAADPKRFRQFDDSEPVMPVIPASKVLPKDGHGDPADLLARSSATCPHCQSVSGIRLCPDCHSTLPRELSSSSPLFGLVGVRSSGKTVFLSVLQDELIHGVGRRFDASIEATGGTSGLSKELVRIREGMSHSGGKLPRQTDATGSKKKAPAVYEWRKERKSTIFSFYDTAGEDVGDQEKVLQQRYMAQATGVILLLDPFAFPENHERARERGVSVAEANTPESALDGITYLLKTQHKIKRNRKIRTPVAVVVPKIDAFFDQVPSQHPLRQSPAAGNGFDDEESLTVHDHMAAMITEWGGDNLLRNLRENYEHFRLFGVSALGAEPDYRSGHVSSRGLLPLRVADPLIWLLAHHGAIPKAKSQVRI